ncbi:MAG: hypothetical protein V3T53_12965 [Phycisphaerales bacterium]
MSPFRAIIGLLLVVAVGRSACWGADVSPKQRLAAQYLRSAMSLMEAGPVTVEGLDGAVFLVQRATDLDPDNAELWRAQLELIDLQERLEDDELRHTVLENLVRLDPEDDVVRLRQISASLAQHQTIKERIEAYQRLLSSQNPAQLGPAITSRLAFDLAMLFSREDDAQGYAKWLGEAVAADPSNRAAAAAATGFFRMNVQDAFAEAELLTSLMLADPADVVTKSTLAQLLLDHAAYAAADRIYRVTERTYEAGGSLSPNGMLADHAVARWGRGQVKDALLTIRVRQDQADTAFRRSVQQQNPELTRLELARLHAPVAATLATIRAAIHNRLGDDQVESSMRGVRGAYEAEIERLRSTDDIDPRVVADRLRQAAWVFVWLGGNVDDVVAFLEAAKQVLGDEDLSPTAQARFDGWLALRLGEVDQAIVLLEPVAEDDAPAALGLALARLEKGERRDAARGLLRVARAQPGSLIGVWASDLLAELIDRRLQPAELDPLATQLKELIESVPLVYDRFPDQPTLAVSLRIVPAKDTFDPYEPVIVNLQITNHAPFPLAIDSGGPIRPRVILIPTIQIPRDLRVNKLAPIVVDIDRRLRLEPRQTLVIPVDLRRSHIDGLLNTVHPLRGALLKIRAVLNFWVPRQGVIRAGLLGSEIEIQQPIRVNGIRLNPVWLEHALGVAIDPDSADDLATMALLSRLAPGLDPNIQVTPELIELLQDSGQALAEGYAKLDPISQAWMLGVVPRIVVMEPVLAMARKSTDKHVQISYLLFHVVDPADPMLDAAKRSDDPDVKYAAEFLESAMNRAAAARANQ